MKKVLVLMVALLVGFVLIGCKDSGTRQGITEEFILVGNTAASSGDYSSVGVPFNLAMNVVFDEYNATHEGPDIKLVHYDDGFNGTNGLALTKKLVEEDKVFALVGHFGTDTVNSTMDYLLEKGIPMVYAATGVNSLYYEEEVGNNILSVQPIYRTEGRMMVARTLHEALYGANKDAKLGATDKVVVLYSTDDAGQSIKLGVEEEVAAQNATSRFTYLPFSSTDASSVAATALAQNPKAIILSANQVPATAMLTALRQNNNTAPVITSYVNSAKVVAPAQEIVEAVAQALPFDVFANAWVDISQAAAPAPTSAQIGGNLVGFNDGATDAFYALGEAALAYLPNFTAEYWNGFVKSMNTSTRTEGTTAARALWADAYAIAGYIAAKTFVDIIERVEDITTVTWEDFIALGESAPIDIPMAGTIDWTNGKRVGLTELAFNKYQFGASGWSFVKVRGIESITVVNGK